jgi:hypothetical protein
VSSRGPKVTGCNRTRLGQGATPAAHSQSWHALHRRC